MGPQRRIRDELVIVRPSPLLPTHLVVARRAEPAVVFREGGDVQGRDQALAVVGAIAGPVAEDDVVVLRV